MTTCTSPIRNIILSVSIVGLVLTAAGAVRAEEPPDSTDIIQSALPDSLSIDGKVVYVDFWASWCMPCRQSFPWMQKMYERYHEDGLEVVAVNVDKDHSAALQFLKETGVTFPVVYDSTADLAKSYGLEVMPSSFVYGRDGHLSLQHHGFRADEADSVQTAIRRLIEKGNSD
jgi:thiol-disulfide isomerase/thioredoxin